MTGGTHPAMQSRRAVFPAVTRAGQWVEPPRHSTGFLDSLASPRSRIGAPAGASVGRRWRAEFRSSPLGFARLPVFPGCQGRLQPRRSLTHELALGPVFPGCQRL